MHGAYWQMGPGRVPTHVDWLVPRGRLVDSHSRAKTMLKKLVLLAACLEPLVKKKSVEGRSHAAISVPLLSSKRALRVGIVILFFLQGVCGTPAAPPGNQDRTEESATARRGAEGRPTHSANSHKMNLSWISVWRAEMQGTPKENDGFWWS